MRIVVVTATGDVSVPPVAQHFTSDTELVVVDPARTFDGQSLSFRLTETGPAVVSHCGTELADVHGVWYRKPLVLRAPSLPVPADYQEYALNGWEALTRCLMSQFPDAVWVSDYFAIQRSQCKARQLALAKSIGFSVPDTLMTSDPRQAREFVQRLGTCVVKPLAARSPKGSVLYTTRITAGRPLNFDGLIADPVIFQACLEPARELRVTVVGDEVFAAEVGGGEEAFPGVDVRDWRANAGQGTFWARETSMPDQLQAHCVKFLQASGLNFGAFDFIEDHNGKYWFLECNPNGQWLFIEDTTGMPISAAIAGMLTRRTLANHTTSEQP
ncbi:hypothetical protein [Labedaea rhizosphaerae]|uniref:RimK-like ATP-grasp domain-containing protein n=1 Tax=Labedaea rhizosphaerae TaxID=598644 RepID=A0A4R6S9L3_LABRH|nr:hypothetical protein [Labedaea rhizosphaerae]TDP96622.1 RimK-like ATP-grasp domain-containing protein [Labedaea rhizosphaerae]